ncbi:MAG: hypothetical protein QM759_13450 [Terricaulis sp.]
MNNDAIANRVRNPQDSGQVSDRRGDTPSRAPERIPPRPDFQRPARSSSRRFDDLF